MQGFGGGRLGDRSLGQAVDDGCLGAVDDVLPGAVRQVLDDNVLVELRQLVIRARQPFVHVPEPQHQHRVW